MSLSAPKVRSDLEYFEREVDGDEIVFVRDPVRNTWFRYNLLQAAMLRAMDGVRSAEEIAIHLGREFEMEVPAAAARRFADRARELMLLDVRCYGAMPDGMRGELRGELRRRGFRLRGLADRLAAHAPDRLEPSTETLLPEALRHLERGHPVRAVDLLGAVLDRDPDDPRARELHGIIQTAFVRSGGGTTDFPSWRLFDPSRLLGVLDRAAGRILFGGIGVIAIVAFIAAGAACYAQVRFDSDASATAFAVVLFNFVIHGFLHELGHGLACFHYGGKVTEIGITLFYYVIPAPYCDTSSTYTFESRRHKLIVQVAGVTVSLLYMSTLSILLTVLRPELPIYDGIELALIVESAVVFLTLLPFIKNDGYYALCDYSGFPNLRDRSFKLGRAWLKRHVLGLEADEEPLSPAARRWLLLYAAVAVVGTAGFVYWGYGRLLAPLVENLRGAGLAIAVVVLVVVARKALIRPAVEAARLIARERRRIFTRRRSLGFGAAAIVLLAPWLITWPVYVDTEFVLVPRERADVRAEVPGLVDRVLVREGERVARGQAIAVLRDDALQTRRRVLAAQLAEVDARLAGLRRGYRPEEIALASQRAAVVRAELQRDRHQAALTSRLAEAGAGPAGPAALARGEAAVARSLSAAARWEVTRLEAGPRSEDIRAAEAERAGLAAELESARIAEERLTMRAPIDGVVVTPRVHELVATRLEPGDKLAEVHDTSRFLAEMKLPSWAPLAELTMGDEIALRSLVAADREIGCLVARIRPASGEEEPRLTVVSSPFVARWGRSGMVGHARLYGRRHTLAYSRLYLPVERILRVDLWSL